VEKGADGFTISEVARRGDLNRALVYHYFKDRNNLITHAVEFIIGQDAPDQPEFTTEAAERSTRRYIAHPEVGRLIFQLLLTGRPLGRLGDRLAQVVEAAQSTATKEIGDRANDPAFAVFIMLLAQLSWSFARGEVARILNIPVEEADERFIDELRTLADLSIRSFTEGRDAATGDA
jgi:AcrR family transcriptional regulator